MTAACVHHWKIATPQGATSAGVCLRCGAVRDFANTWDDSAWVGRERLPVPRPGVPLPPWALPLSPVNAW